MPAPIHPFIAATTAIPGRAWPTHRQPFTMMSSIPDGCSCWARRTASLPAAVKAGHLPTSTVCRTQRLSMPWPIRRAPAHYLRRHGRQLGAAQRRRGAELCLAGGHGPARRARRSWRRLRRPPHPRQRQPTRPRRPIRPRKLPRRPRRRRRPTRLRRPIRRCLLLRVHRCRPLRPAIRRPAPIRAAPTATATSTPVPTDDAGGNSHCYAGSCDPGDTDCLAWRLARPPLSRSNCRCPKPG